MAKERGMTSADTLLIGLLFVLFVVINSHSVDSALARRVALLEQRVQRIEQPTTITVVSDEPTFVPPTVKGYDLVLNGSGQWLYIRQKEQQP